MLLGKELITEAIVDDLLSWRYSGFSAHGAVRVEDRQGAVRLGRYMIRCPIVLKRLSWETETGEVVCRGRPSRRGRPDGGEARWDVLEFLARVVDHVPEPSQQTVRYWGYYANAARGKRRKAAQGGNAIQTPPSQDDDEFSRRARLTWAKLIRRVYEVDPLLCPFCGAVMKILAFIVDFPSAGRPRQFSSPRPARWQRLARHRPSSTTFQPAHSPQDPLRRKAISYTARYLDRVEVLIKCSERCRVGSQLCSVLDKRIGK